MQQIAAVSGGDQAANGGLGRASRGLWRFGAAEVMAPESPAEYDVG
jgi:hypothetical protein